MDIPSTPQSPTIPEQVPPPSLLDQIIQTAQESSLPNAVPPVPVDYSTTAGSTPP
jgi:hypothetical protein